MNKENIIVVPRYLYSFFRMQTTLNYAVPTAHKTEAAARIVDLSGSGIRMRIEEGTLEEGNMLRVRIQVSDIQASVPTLGEVIRAKKQDADAYHAGLKFVV